ncbi:hypothetical protein [endosymbiont GvMRE of Glomus versiforme]|uniref:hypothetical protein n=1 Tax=endosymbiont GvMRE of Glomus versiforme TaxID=2039283 RepID=UPI000EE10FE9|nr:hypothetical protein [endosymbiont GvMRE of Glomus versiforme]RHZ36719.1 hypothetical protein GvMRE_I2g386 [endosymbiont GvMRE of Glomus versiforme]
MTNPFDKVNPKKVMKEWLSEQYEKRIKQPIAKKTEELENQVSQQINTYSQKAQETAYKPVDYYKKQEPFYRGLFWIAVALLLILWILSGS